MMAGDDLLSYWLMYDPISGNFTWRHSPKYDVYVGDVAGSLRKDGYWKITVQGKHYLAHRLAWYFMYGCWPTDLIDHIDCNKSNNAIANLREANKVLNSQNRKNIVPKNKAGLLGAYKKRHRWESKIVVDGVIRRLGIFDTPAEASEAYMIAKQQYHDFYTL